MGDVIREVTQVGLLTNLKNAVIGVFVGIFFFFGSFVLLFWNEGRVNLAAVAKTSVAAPADKVDAALDGKFVSVSGAIAATDPIGDPDLVRPGPWVRLARQVETYAWEEKETKESRNKVGGGTEETTTWTYKQDWVTTVKKSADFKEPKGHENPAAILVKKDFLVPVATVGAYHFTPNAGDVDTANKLELTSEIAIAAVGSAMPAAMAPVSGTVNALGGRTPQLVSGNGTTYLFIGTGSLAAPKVGDTRVSYSVLSTGANVTLFGRNQGGAIDPFPYQEGSTFQRVLLGNRETAIATLAFEDALMRWILRGVGFLLMWIGMSSILHPIVAVANIIPFLGEATKAAIGCVTFPIALALSSVTIVVSMVLHSIVATLAVGVIVFAVVILVLRSRKPPTPVAA